MVKDNRNNGQIYGRNDMIMLDQNNKIYGSLGLADKYVMKTEEGTKLTLSNPKLGSFDDVLTEFNIYGMSKQESTTGANLIDVDSMLNECLVKNADDTYSILRTETNRFSKSFPVNLKAGTKIRFDADVIEYNGTYHIKLQCNFGQGDTVGIGQVALLRKDVTKVTIYQEGKNDVGTYTKFKNAMLSIGEEKIPYEPYTGGKPSPSPEYPQEIKSVVNPTVKVSNEDGTKSQTVTLPYTLNAIPVSSGGNVTIDGQQYIADRVVEKDGVFGIERNTAIDVPALTKTLKETSDVKGRFLQNNAFKKTFTSLYAPLVNIGYGKIWGMSGGVIDKWIFGVNKVSLYISPPKDLNYTSEDILNALKDLDIKVYGVLLVPFFEPFLGDIQAKLRALVTYYPVTIVENNYNTWMKATYKSTESV